MKEQSGTKQTKTAIGQKMRTKVLEQSLGLLHNYHISTPVVKSSQSSHIYTGREGKFHFYEVIYLATSPKAPANTSVSQAWTLELWDLRTLNSFTLLKRTWIEAYSIIPIFITLPRSVLFCMCENCQWNVHETLLMCTSNLDTPEE